MTGRVRLSCLCAVSLSASSATSPVFSFAHVALRAYEASFFWPAAAVFRYLLRRWSCAMSAVVISAVRCSSLRGQGGCYSWWLAVPEFCCLWSGCVCLLTWVLWVWVRRPVCVGLASCRSLLVWSRCCWVLLSCSAVRSWLAAIGCLRLWWPVVYLGSRLSSSRVDTCVCFCLCSSLLPLGLMGCSVVSLVFLGSGRGSTLYSCLVLPWTPLFTSCVVGQFAAFLLLVWYGRAASVSGFSCCRLGGSLETRLPLCRKVPVPCVAAVPPGIVCVPGKIFPWRGSSCACVSKEVPFPEIWTSGRSKCATFEPSVESKVEEWTESFLQGKTPYWCVNLLPWPGSR